MAILSKQNLWLWLLCFGMVSCAPTGKWFSPVTNGLVSYKVKEPKTPETDFVGNRATIVYLKNLNIDKIGQNSNSKDINWLLSQGYRVVVFNYKNHKNTVATAINQDIIAFNDSLASGRFCNLTNCSTYKTYILFEGYRIWRDIPYFVDNPKVYNTPKEYTVGDTLHMDIVYPTKPTTSIPVILSFSYSNSYAAFNQDEGNLTNANKDLRMHLPYTLAGFNDSVLEGAPAHGMAWAIADHPKYCPWGSGKPENGKNDTYKSYQTNPDAAQKVKSAIRVLRTKAKTLDLSGNIGIYGFSRGATAGAMAIGNRKVPEFENAGFNIGANSQVQAAALGPGVFDYTIIYNTLNNGDANLELRCPWAWGELQSNYSLWKTMGANYLVETSSAPVLFFYNTGDAPYYSEQIAHLKKTLDSLKVPTQTLVDYGNGHTVPQTFSDLNTVYHFFKTYLKQKTK
ncbi:MAG: alpha/beta hydrolase family protein [Flavobacteriaceae bacterium]